MTAPHVAICIATYRRPAGLQRLLQSLDRLEFPPGEVPHVSVIVVDNDVGAAPSPVQSRFPAAYHVEPRRGLAHVRNACLALVPPHADFVAFLDDDEWVEPQWLAALLAMQRATGAEIVQGPVLPRYAVEPPNWLIEGHYHEVGPFEDGQSLTHGATGNVLIARAALDRTGVRFSEDFNASGGEDVDFFAAMLARDCRIVAAAAAIAHEDVPVERMTLAWVLNRRYRTGHTLGLVAKRQGGRFRRLAKAVARIFHGLAQTLLGTLSSTSTARHGMANVLWGLGTLAAFVGLSVDHYSRATGQQDPARRSAESP